MSGLSGEVLADVAKGLGSFYCDVIEYDNGFYSVGKLGCTESVLSLADLAAACKAKLVRADLGYKISGSVEAYRASIFNRSAFNPIAFHSCHGSGESDDLALILAFAQAVRSGALGTAGD